LHCVESGVARKHERQGEEVQLLHLWRPVDCRSYRKVDDPLLQKLELGCLRTSGSPAIEVIRDLNASLRPILDGGGKPVGRPAPRGLLARVDGHLELGFVLRRERSSREKAGDDDEEDSCAFHAYILAKFADYIQTITRRLDLLTQLTHLSIADVRDALSHDEKRTYECVQCESVTSEPITKETP